MSNWWILVVTILLIWYVYALQYSPIGKPKMFLDDVLHKFKTGDIILFKAYDNFNSLMHTSYYGHMGIVYVGEDNIPMLFEANGIDTMPLKDHHSRSGIFFTPVVDRIKKYKGRVCWKRLNHPITTSTASSFREFIDYCLNNMYYDMGVISAGFKKYFGFKRCGLGTNCGDIVFLSLIKLGLISIDEYDIPRIHHLKYVVGIESLLDGYSYLDLIEVIDHPFTE